MPFVSSGTRSLANEINATVCPSALIDRRHTVPIRCRRRSSCGVAGQNGGCHTGRAGGDERIARVSNENVLDPIGRIGRKVRCLRGKSDKLSRTVLFRLMLGFSLSPFRRGRPIWRGHQMRRGDACGGREVAQCKYRAHRFAGFRRSPLPNSRPSRRMPQTGRHTTWMVASSRHPRGVVPSRRRNQRHDRNAARRCQLALVLFENFLRVWG